MGVFVCFKFLFKLAFRIWLLVMGVRQLEINGKFTAGEKLEKWRTYMCRAALLGGEMELMLLRY